MKSFDPPAFRGNLVRVLALLLVLLIAAVIIQTGRQPKFTRGVDPPAAPEESSSAIVGPTAIVAHATSESEDPELQAFAAKAAECREFFLRHRALRKEAIQAQPQAAEFTSYARQAAAKVTQSDPMARYSSLPPEVQDAARQLLLPRSVLRIAVRTDEIGNKSAGHYARVAASGADSVATILKQWRKTGAAFFKEQPIHSPNIASWDELHDFLTGIEAPCTQRFQELLESTAPSETDLLPFIEEYYESMLLVELAERYSEDPTGVTERMEKQFAKLYSNLYDTMQKHPANSEKRAKMGALWKAISE